MSRRARLPEALVVGAGIAGAATAWHLARAGVAVDLVEAQNPAWGASGRNPGFLWLQTKPAGTTMAFALAGRRFAEELASQLPDYGFRGCGGLVVYRDAQLADVARDFAADRSAAGLPTTHISGPEARRLCPNLSPAVAGAVWNPLDAHQVTRRLVEALVADAKAAGCRVHEHSRVSRLATANQRCVGVEMANGETIGAGTTVIAAGPSTNALLEPVGLGFPMDCVRFEAAETAPAAFQIGPVVCGQALFKFFNASGKSRQELPSHPAETAWPKLGFTEQIAQFPDGTLQFGCAFESGTCDDQPTVGGQAMAAAVMCENFAELGDLALRRVWAGIVAQTPDGLPVIDANPGIEGLAINAGHFFGNLVGAFSGRMLCDVLQGKEPPYAVEPFRLGRFAAANQSGTAVR